MSCDHQVENAWFHDKSNAASNTEACTAPQHSSVFSIYLINERGTVALQPIHIRWRALDGCNPNITWIAVGN